MNLFATCYPLTPDPEDVLACQQREQIVNWFCSDVQVRGAYPSYIRRFSQNTTSKSKWNPAMRRF